MASRPRSFAVLFFVCSLCGCAPIVPPAAPPAATGVPVAAPRTIAPESPVSAEHKRMVAMFDGEYHHAAAEHYLNEVLVKLARAGAASDPNLPYRVTLLNSPTVNAFALPPNDLYVTRGLLALANDTSEVAAVMAHEISHITARHAMQRAEEERRAAVISKAAAIIQNKQRGQEVEAVAKRTLARFSRQQELDADQSGIRIIAKAGYDPYGASRFLSALGRSTELRNALIGQGGGDRLDILATHPSTPERVEQAIAAARQIGAPGIGSTGRNSYLSAINGVMFGDDPANGAIRGLKFIHPRLGFGFVAPEGFMLENSAQAVLGIAAGGNEALRLDSVKLPQTTALETYANSGWIDGLIASSLTPVTVDGAPALLAHAEAGEWHFRIAVIRFDTQQVYRLIFATRVMTDDAERRFQASIDSFHRISPEEARGVHPLHIEIVTAEAGDTPETMAKKMVVPNRPLDYFLLINGREPDSVLRPDERYKIVVE
ncbi:M48 family metalloprotease [Beijerinckia indica]|uniref:M48 family metalloprotease n=1 Tax=Beijerinckia indica TaxID=533 RepID=UPI00030C8D21|nr:M48 family metalloprotease [Beijerinckia indica]